MTKYKISCLDCKKEFIIDDEEFTAIVENMEKETQRLTSILHKHKVPVSYKSHDHVYAIVRTLMRCCTSFNPEIYMTEVNEKEDRKFEELKKKCKEYRELKSQLQVWTKRLGCIGLLCEPLGSNHVKISGIVYNNR